MKISQTLTQSSIGHFCNEETGLIVCNRFTFNLLGGITPSHKVKYTFSKTNPKKKGFRKCEKEFCSVILHHSMQHFYTTSSQDDFFEEQLIHTGDVFWMKAENV
jgi:hypothetical protein